MFGHGCGVAGVVDAMVVTDEAAFAATKPPMPPDQKARGDEQRSRSATEAAEAASMRLVVGRESVGEVVLIHRKPPGFVDTEVRDVNLSSS
jgi:hypothetical protein